MIGDFLHRLARDVGQRGIRRGGDLLQQQLLPVREQELARDGLREIAVGLLDQKTVLEIEHVAKEREFVRVTPLAFRRARDAQEMRRLTDQIEPDIGERQIDLQHRRMPAPLRQPLTEDQRVVAEADGVVEPLTLIRHGRA